MAVGYIPLPAYRAGGQLDFSGLNQGLDDLGRSIEKNRLLAEQKEIGKALQSGGQGQPTATSSSQPQYGKQNALLPNYASSIAGIETGSFKEPYTAQGPVVKSGDRAYGKYQVMGSNIGPWTREILGQEMTPAQFLTSPEAQEKVFAAKFGSYVQETGNPQDAASMWFTGRPAAEGADRRARDANGNPLGITGREYVEKFSAGLGQPSPQDSRNIPAAPPQGGMNYANAANVAFGQGNLDIGMQLANAQRAEQEAAYNRQRQGVADQRAAETHELGMEDTQDQMRNRLVDRMAGVAQSIRNEADPQRKDMMVRKLFTANPRLRQTLIQYGFDPRNPDPTMDMIIAEARGFQAPTKRDFIVAKPGDVVLDPVTQQPVYTAPARPNAGVKPPAGYRYAQDGETLEAIPGGPATKIPSGDAAKLAALQTAERSFEDAKKFYQNSDFLDRGNQILNRGNAGRAERTVRLAVESALRAMTGAAAPDSEVESYMNLFGPTAWDTAKTAADKLARLESFLANVRANMEQGRGPVAGAPSPATGTQAPQSAPATRLRFNPETGELE